MKEYLETKIEDADHELARLNNDIDELVSRIKEKEQAVATWEGMKRAWKETLDEFNQQEAGDGEGELIVTEITDEDCATQESCDCLCKYYIDCTRDIKRIQQGEKEMKAI